MEKKVEVEGIRALWQGKLSKEVLIALNKAKEVLEREGKKDISCAL